MKVKAFSKKAQITRAPGTGDQYPGTAEVGVDAFNTPEGWEGQLYSPQSDQYSNSIPSGLSRGLSENQIRQLIQKMKGTVDEKQLDKLKQEHSNDAVLVPLLSALKSDKEITALVQNACSK